MKLILLEPQFLRHEYKRETRRFRQSDGQEYDRTGDYEYNVFVDSLSEAQGVIFLCPKCYEANKGPENTHSVLCWFRDREVPEEASPKPGRWAASGTGYADLTLMPSILITAGCRWHGYVTAGEVTSC